MTFAPECTFLRRGPVIPAEEDHSFSLMRTSRSVSDDVLDYELSLSSSSSVLGKSRADFFRNESPLSSILWAL